MIRKSFIAALLLLPMGAFAGSVVLQQGVAGYSGCSDSYIQHANQVAGAIPVINDLNFGRDDSIYSTICKT